MIAENIEKYNWGSTWIHFPTLFQFRGHFYWLWEPIRSGGAPLSWLDKIATNTTENWNGIKNCFLWYEHVLIKTIFKVFIYQELCDKKSQTTLIILIPISNIEICLSLKMHKLWGQNNETF